MAMFNSPTAFFVGNTNPKEKQFEKRLLKNAKKKGYTKFIEPCSGELAMCQLAIEAGFTDIEASDITLFSTLMGYYVEEKGIEELEVEVEGIGRCNDVVEILYYLLLFRLKKQEGKFYFDNLIEDVETKKEWHKEKIKETLDKAKKVFGGKVKYEPLDMVEHLKRYMYDEKAVVIMNFPTYKGGYEKHFDVGDKIKWKEPEYAMFDPSCDKEKIKEMLADAKCLVLFYEEAYPNETCFDPVYVRFGAREGMNTYITTNDLCKASELIEGKCAVWLNDKALTPLPYPIIDKDYVFTEKSEVKVIPATTENCNYYRKLFTHNFTGSSSDSGFAVIVDNKVLGVFGYSKAFSSFFGDGSNEDLFLLFGMAKSVNGFRPNRLLTMLAMTKEIAFRICDDLEKFSYKNLKSAMISKYPESKQMRGIMKMSNRTFDKTLHMYRLEYLAELTDHNIEEVYKLWLKKEKEYKKLQK